MIKIEVLGGQQDPQSLAELIASTLHGTPVLDRSLVEGGKLVRETQQDAEAKRPSHQELQTVNFQTIEADEDWTEV